MVGQNFKKFISFLTKFCVLEEFVAFHKVLSCLKVSLNSNKIVEVEKTSYVLENNATKVSYDVDKEMG